MATRLKWNGDKVLAKLERATIGAIDEVTEDAARDASRSHWWVTRSRQLQSSVVNEPARKVGRNRIRGRFGATRIHGFYGLILERRSPFLRPAADRTFPRLAKMIARRMG